MMDECLHSEQNLSNLFARLYREFLSSFFFKVLYAILQGLKLYLKLVFLAYNR